MPRLSGKRAVITGAAQGIGKAIAERFAAEGATLLLADVDGPRVTALAAALGQQAFVADVSKKAEVEALIAHAAEIWGGIDVLVNVAGGFVWQTLADGGSDTWARMYAMNAATCVNMTKAALPVLSATGGASIVNIGAGGALVAAAGMGAYAASKSAVHKLTESLAAELAETDCTVNAVLPSIIDTPTNRADMPDADFTKWVSPEAVAQVILFLASPAARSINGALIPVSRGG